MRSSARSLSSSPPPPSSLLLPLPVSLLYTPRLRSLEGEGERGDENEDAGESEDEREGADPHAHP